MKSFGRIAIAAMLAIVPMVAAATAWANTELVPGSRLVAPYWTSPPTGARCCF